MKFKLKEWIAKVTALLAEQRDATNPLIIHKSYEYTRSTSLSAGTSLSITGSDVNYSVPTGYSLLGIRNAYSSQAQLEVSQFRFGTGSGQFVRVRNGGTSSISSFTIYVGVNFIRSDYYKSIT